MPKNKKAPKNRSDDRIDEELNESGSEDSPEEVNSSKSSIESVHVPLSQLKNRNIFLTKVGFAFTIYFMVLFAMCIFILLDVTHTRTLYRAMYLDKVMWIFLAVSLAIKVSVGFLSARLRSFVIYLYVLDIALSAFFIVGLYYFLDDKIANQYSNKAPFVIIYVLNLFASAFIFTVTTFYKSKSRVYNFFIGASVMVLVNIALTLGMMFGWKTVVTITVPQYVAIMIIWSSMTSTSASTPTSWSTGVARSSGTMTRLVASIASGSTGLAFSGWTCYGRPSS